MAGAERKTFDRRSLLIGALAALAAPRARAESLSQDEERLLERRAELQQELQSSYDSLTALVKGSSRVPASHGHLREPALTYLRPIWNAYGTALFELERLGKKIATGARTQEIKNSLQQFTGALNQARQLGGQAAPPEVQVYCSFVQNVPHKQIVVAKKKERGRHRGRRYAKN